MPDILDAVPGLSMLAVALDHGKARAAIEIVS